MQKKGKCMRKITLPAINIILILLAAGLAVSTFFNRHLMKILFSYTAYYLIFILFIIWGITLARCIFIYKPDIRQFLKKNFPGILLALVLTTVIFISVESSMRVLSDQANLLSISRTMTYEGRADNVTMGKWYYDMFYPIARQTPIRPLLFPFLCHFLHTILGYRVANIFLLNGIILFMFLSAVYAFINKYLGQRWAFSAVFLIASQPVIAETATSGAYDLLAALFLFTTFLSLSWFLKEPSSIKFQLVWINLLMIVNIRHEGMLTFLIVIALLGSFKYIKASYFKGASGIIYCSSPLILLLIFWQRLLAKDPLQIMQTGKPPFLISYFFRNNIEFFKSLVNFKFFLPYATIVNLIGFSALIYFGYLFVAKKIARTPFSRHLIYISSAALGLNWILLTSFRASNVTLPAAGRYFIIFCVVLTLLSIAFFNKFRIFRMKSAYILAFSIVIFLLYHRVSIEDRFSRTQTLPRKYRFVMNYLNEEAKKNKNFLVITNRPGHVVSHNYGAVNFQYANSNGSLIKSYKNHLFSNMFVVQDIRYSNGKATPGTHLRENYKLETLAESQITSTYFARISKVVDTRRFKSQPVPKKSTPEQ